MKHQEFFILLIIITYQNGQTLKNHHYYVKIINHRIKHKNNDNSKTEELNIDTMIDSQK